MSDTKPTILLSIPAEIWKCEIVVNKVNPLAEAEALVLESLHAAGNIGIWAEKIGAMPPHRTLSSLISQNFVTINASGDAEVKEQIVEIMEGGGLIELLSKRQGQKFSFWVVRDLLTGSFHHRRIIYETSQMKSGWMGIEAEQQVANREHDDLEILNVKDIVQPIRGTIAYEFNIKPHLVSAACRMVDVESEETTITIPFRWHKMQDGATVPIPMHHQDLGNVIVDSRLITALHPHRVETETKRLWPASPELDAMTKIDILKKMTRRVQKGHVKVGPALLESLRSEAIAATEAAIAEIEKNELPRINSAKSIVGTEFDQWNAIQAVINSSTSKCVLLTAFTHPNFADEAAARINDSLPEGCELLLLSGEPDRIHETGFAERTKEYEKALLKHELSGSVRVENTRRASHAKFVISDSGMIWIGSCNMLSAAPGSWVMETGLLIDDVSVCKSIISHVLNDKWLNPSDEEFLLDIEEMLPNVIQFEPKNARSLRNYAKDLMKVKIGKDQRYGYRIADYTTRMINELTKYAKKPCWSLIETEQHRPLFLSLVRESRKRIVIGTDAIRAGGLDKATIEEISRRPVEALHRASKFITQICWGRQDPDFKKKDEEILEAGKRLDILRKKIQDFDDSGDGLRSLFYPRDNKPMMNHGKFIAIDEKRLVITSDNLLSFADDEGWDSDARELGILIDSPEIARRHRAEIDLLNDSRHGDQYDRARWHGAFAGCLDELGGEATFHELMEVFIERIQSSEQLHKDWFWSVDFICNQYKIDVQTAPYAILTEGENDRFYKLKWVGEMKPNTGKWIPNIRSDDERLNLLRIVKFRESGNWRDFGTPRPTPSGLYQPINVGGVTTVDENALTPKKVNPTAIQLTLGEKFAEEFSQALIDTMQPNPDIWQHFGDRYGKLSQRDSKLKIKKPSKFLSLCAEWIEVSYTEDGVAWIRRRQV